MQKCRLAKILAKYISYIIKILADEAGFTSLYVLIEKDSLLNPEK